MKKTIIILLTAASLTGCPAAKRLTRADWDCAPRHSYGVNNHGGGFGNRGETVVFTDTRMGLNPGGHYCND